MAKWNPVSELPDDWRWFDTLFVYNSCNGPDSIWPCIERDREWREKVHGETVREFLERDGCWSHWLDPKSVPGLPPVDKR